MFVYTKLSSLNPDVNPQVYGPRWSRLEDAPEAIRHLLVEVSDVFESAIERLPAGVTIEARVSQLYGSYLTVSASKETFWDAVREALDETHTTEVLRNGEVEIIPATFSQVSIMKVRGDGWAWEFDVEGASVDPSDYVYIQANMLDLDEGDNLDLAVQAMIWLRDLKAWYKT